ncbi:MAG TPA: sugar phosphate isomerase/epimerase family protein [Bacteroidales bacterium]|jgi:hypothetical protein|nr:sugar phosphate isomerase/epimerase family protein [Bacteroidales bacterium]HQH24475.1 sugar phosphate isomerase/epimerase family protein [Bacteroidales bacterium]HQJ82549.1 sugar phosphate isomerase/epimerase family protein [Bacteroidales bacterium]
MKKQSRRSFIGKLAVAGAGTAAAGIGTAGLISCKPGVKSSDTPGGVFKRRYKLSLNAYSLNQPLRDGSMNLFDLLEFSSENGFDGVDLTGYYFPGYPEVPSDEYLYSVKKRAFQLGLFINGTGIKNDFTWSDRSKREEGKELIRNWVIVAEKLGAPSLRIFTGNLSKEEFSWEERAEWIAEDIRECAGFGKKHGVMMAVQNKNDFISDASHVDKMFKMINHDWAGLMLDMGSYRVPDPYAEMASNSKYAISWLIQEKIYINDQQTDPDYGRIRDMVRECGYQGFLQLETLGEGDPVVKIRTLFDKVNSVFNS